MQQAKHCNGGYDVNIYQIKKKMQISSDKLTNRLEKPREEAIVGDLIILTKGSRIPILLICENFLDDAHVF